MNVQKGIVRELLAFGKPGCPWYVGRRHSLQAVYSTRQARQSQLEPGSETGSLWGIEIARSTEATTTTSSSRY